MANALNPTAANILSSLGIRGATVSDNSPGFVPVLDASGKISAKLIPATAAQLAIPPLSDVAYIDPYTTVEELAPGGERLRVGSVIAPFKSLFEASEHYVPSAAAIEGGYAAFLLAPGEYSGDYGMNFALGTFQPQSIYLIGLGDVKLDSSGFTISGLSATTGALPKVWLQNINTNGVITINGAASVTVLGKSFVNNLYPTIEGSALFLSSESKVGSVGLNFATIGYLSELSRIGNTSTVAGATAQDALNRLGGRKIRIAKAEGSGSTFDVGSSFEDVSAESAGGFDVFDLQGRDRAFASAIRNLYTSLEDIKCNSIDAHTIVADSIKTKELRMDSLLLGGYRLSIDAYGYLVVVDGSKTPPRPPDSLVLLRDSVTGTVYMLTMEDGRMYIKPADDESDPPLDELVVYDPDSGDEYKVTVEDGKAIIEKLPGSGTGT